MNAIIKQALGFVLFATALAIFFKKRLLEFAHKRAGGNYNPSGSRLNIMTVITGLVLSVALTVWTSRTDVGQWARRAGLFLTPEETDPPRELRRLAAAEADPPAPADPAGLVRVPPTRPSAIMEQSLSTWAPPGGIVPDRHGVAH